MGENRAVQQPSNKCSTLLPLQILSFGGFDASTYYRQHFKNVCAKTYDWGCIAESLWCRFWCEDILKGMPNELSNQAFCYFLAVEESSLLVLSVDVRLMGFCAAFCSWLFTKGAISLAPSYYLVRTPLTLKANTSFEVRSVKNRKLQSRQNMFSWPSKQV